MSSNKVLYTSILLLVILCSNYANGDSTYYQRPFSPTISSTVQHERVYITWDNTAESSIDSVTSYRDFEGYRIYKSKDRGLTWGNADDRIYDFQGNFIGWKPYSQFDLTEDDDEDFCIYMPDCSSSDPKRGIDISGPDPLNPRFSLGEDTGLQYTFIDTHVVNGIEYSYTVTSYDMGLRTFTIEYADDDSNGVYEADTTWSISNPGHFLGPDTVSFYDLNGTLVNYPNPDRGFPSLESQKGSYVLDQNFVTVVPGDFASNLTFPEEFDDTTFFVANLGNIGTGPKSYFIADMENLGDALLKFEIQADLGSNSGEGMACEDPFVYVYEISDSISQTPTAIDTTYNILDLTESQIDSIIDLPGADSSSGEISVPEYKLISGADKESDTMDGIRFLFDNIPDIMPSDREAFIDTLEYDVDSVFQNTIVGTIEYLNAAAYARRLNFDYRIDFFESPGADTVVSGGCPGGTKTALPFRITNITTGRKVGLQHSDNGYEFPPPSSSLGWNDCTWTRNEHITFFADSLMYQDTILVGVNSFKIILDFDVNQIFPSLSYWSNSKSYITGDKVDNKAMVWIAQSDNIAEEPIEFLDENDDGINDSSWKLYYPWKEGDSIIIRTEKFYTDGDSWVVDMKKIGQHHTPTQDELEQVLVVPNPYIVHSRFNEAPGNRKLRFTHLPQKCKISIYTLTGELVTSFEYDEKFDGNAWWNLRSGKNQDGNEVAPGLYIFLVETEDLKRIGKFAIVR